MTRRIDTCFVILAHADAPKVRRLIAALPGADIFLHCDAKTPADVARAMVPGDRDRVHPVPRHDVALFSWSMVDAELAGLQMAVERSTAAHIAILSGSCYPLASVDEIDAMLESRRGQSVFHVNQIPFPPWDSPWRADGGMWRFQHFFPTRRDNLVTIAVRPVPLWRRRIPPTLELRGAAQWKVYSRPHAKALLGVLRDQQEQLRFWSHTYNPDESCAASVLSSPALVGDLSTEIDNRALWFVNWQDPRAAHPGWFAAADFDLIATEAHAKGFLFARKISSEDTVLLDRIDAELLV
jgi:hypothetical protein